jgi:hypothetical protein
MKGIQSLPIMDNYLNSDFYNRPLSSGNITWTDSSTGSQLTCNAARPAVYYSADTLKKGIV